MDKETVILRCKRDLARRLRVILDDEDSAFDMIRGIKEMIDNLEANADILERLEEKNK